MGRTTKLVDKSRSVWFIPGSFGNRKDKEPFRVLLAPMSAEDFQRLAATSARSMSKLAADGGEDAFAEAIGHNVTDEMIRKHVLSVEGYSGRLADGTVKTPKNGAELLEVIYAADSEELELRNEIARALQDSSVLEAGLEKKSAGPSVSSAPVETSRPAGGLAPNAGVTTEPTPSSPRLSA